MCSINILNVCQLVVMSMCILLSLCLYLFSTGSVPVLYLSFFDICFICSTKQLFSMNVIALLCPFSFINNYFCFVSVHHSSKQKIHILCMMYWLKKQKMSIQPSISVECLFFNHWTMHRNFQGFFVLFFFVYVINTSCWDKWFNPMMCHQFP